MKKFNEWLNIREDQTQTASPQAAGNQMSAGGNTPLAHATGNMDAMQGGQEAEDLHLRPMLQKYLDRFLVELEKAHSMPKAKLVKLLGEIISTMQTNPSMTQSAGFKGVKAGMN